MCTVQLKVERLLWYDNRRGYKDFKAIYIIYEKEEMYPKIRYIAAVTASAAAPSLSWSEGIHDYALRWAEEASQSMYFIYKNWIQSCPRRVAMTRHYYAGDWSSQKVDMSAYGRVCWHLPFGRKESKTQHRGMQLTVLCPSFKKFFLGDFFTTKRG